MLFYRFEQQKVRVGGSAPVAMLHQFLHFYIDFLNSLCLPRVAFDRRSDFFKINFREFAQSISDPL
jgi:hypothetical protein